MANRVTECQWDIPTAGTTEPIDVEQQVLDWLDGSVAAHLVSDVPVAAFLSGGLDSSFRTLRNGVAGAGMYPKWKNISSASQSSSPPASPTA